MSRFLIALLVASSLLGAQAPWWSKDWDAAKEEARLRNVPILICINNDGEEACERALELYRTAEFAALGEKAVLIIGSPAAHKEVRKKAKGGSTGSKRRARFCCERFGNLPCARHRELELSVRTLLWGAKATVRIPSHFVLLPDEQRMWEDMSDVPPITSLAGAIAKAQSKLGKGLSAAQVSEIRSGLEAAESARSGKDLGKLHEELAKLEASCAKTDFEKRVKALSSWLDQECDRRIESIRSHAGEDPLRALAELRTLRTIFRKTPREKLLRKEESKIKKTSAGRKAARILAREDKQRPSFEKARAADREGAFVKAARLYERVVERAPGSPLAQRAERRIRGLMEDRDAGPFVRRDFAKRHLARAKRVLRKDRKAGHDALKQIVEKWPDTPAAKEARELLGQ